MDNEEIDAFRCEFFSFLRADMLLNHGYLTKMLFVDVIPELQKRKEEKLKSMDNDCFGC